jgi:hypothetical protein
MDRQAYRGELQNFQVDENPDGRRKRKEWGWWWRRKSGGARKKV